jgi:hypothetical protein
LLPYASPAGGSFSVSVPTASGRTYYLECTGALADPEWLPLLAVFGDGTTRTLTDPEPSTPQRFYRVRVQE